MVLSSAFWRLLNAVEKGFASEVKLKSNRGIQSTSQSVLSRGYTKKLRGWEIKESNRPLTTAIIAYFELTEP